MGLLFSGARRTGAYRHTSAGRAAALVALSLIMGALSLPAEAQQNKAQPFNMLPLQITNVVVQNGQLVAQGVLGNTTFTAPITLGATAAPTPGACPILNLHLGPIDLNLLGLKVDTSQICLAITAQSGGGNLLGNLLCDVANLLNGGTSLGDILAGLTSAQLNTLLSGLTSLLNNVLSSITSSAAVTGVSGTQAGGCDILNLSLGPVNLNLLGLVVALDNCNNGPVTVDITAQPGAGALLGNLLCNLANLLNNSSASQRAITVHLFNIAQVINALVNL